MSEYQYQMKREFLIDFQRKLIKSNDKRKRTWSIRQTRRHLEKLFGLFGIPFVRFLEMMVKEKKLGQDKNEKEKNQKKKEFITCAVLLFWIFCLYFCVEMVQYILL